MSRPPNCNGRVRGGPSALAHARPVDPAGRAQRPPFSGHRIGEFRIAVSPRRIRRSASASGESRLSCRPRRLALHRPASPATTASWGAYDRVWSAYSWPSGSRDPSRRGPTWLLLCRLARARASLRRVIIGRRAAGSAERSGRGPSTAASGRATSRSSSSSGGADTVRGAGGSSRGCRSAWRSARAVTRPYLTTRTRPRRCAGATPPPSPPGAARAHGRARTGRAQPDAGPHESDAPRLDPALPAHAYDCRGARPPPRRPRRRTCRRTHDTRRARRRCLSSAS